MPIFRYTFKKIIATPSTWIIFALTLMFLMLTWSLILSTLDSETIKSLTKELVLSFFIPVWKDMAFSVLLAIMIFVFISVKATQIFRDEIDDGTLLILVSKPVSRTRIWGEKLLCLQVVVVLYLFLSIFIASVVIAIPSVGSATVYGVVFPYLWILFGVGLIFDLIISSIAILFSLILNAKALIAIMIGMAALFNIFSLSTFVNLVSLTENYFTISQSLVVYNNVKTKLASDDLDWINNIYRVNPKNTIDKIHDAMVAIYTKYILSVKYYPDKYDYLAEQTEVKGIVDGTIINPPTAAPKELVTHIYNISSVFRQWKEQSFEELMTDKHVGISSTHPGINIGNNNVNYSVFKMINGLTMKLSQKDYDDVKSKLSQTKAMRYLNIFYQLKYIWNGISTSEQIGIFSSPDKYKYDSDPYLVSFKPNGNEYQVDDTKPTNSKIINFPALLSVYILIGISLLGASWVVFNRKDFA